MKGESMNTNDSKSSNNSNGKQSGKAKPAKTPPLSSPNEPTRAYPADPSRTYSSDPSQYAYQSNKPSDESSKIYTTEPLDTARIAGEERRSFESQSKNGQEKFEEKTRQGMNREGNGNKNYSDQKREFYNYVASNKEQTITYILLVLGLLILLFANPLFGGLIIGMVGGYYFAEEIVYYIRNLGQIVENKHQDQMRYVVSAALLLGLLIAAPGIFIGAIVVAIFKQVMVGRT